MAGGRNQNLKRGNQVLHVQTEDSGPEIALVTTSLYRGGAVIASKKTRYADILDFENREKLVADLIERQHREMIEEVNRGRYDSEAAPANADSPAESEEETREVSE
ncbi:MAG: hypothetical protein ACRD1Z_07720 [Vicinamibacteria bacterium]